VKQRRTPFIFCKLSITILLISESHLHVRATANDCLVHNRPLGIQKTTSGAKSSVLVACELATELTYGDGEPLELGKAPFEFSDDNTLMPQTFKCRSFISPIVLSLGLRVAQVRLIFDLPAEFSQYDHPLAYVHWYTPLRHTPNDLDTNMFTISRSSHNHRQRASIIPVTKIIRSCHLAPKFGRKMPNTWSSSTVLDDATTFFLNPYLRHHDFFLLRYLLDLYVSRKALRRTNNHFFPEPSFQFLSPKYYCSLAWAIFSTEATGLR
jgi:hypothetical protein